MTNFHSKSPFNVGASSNKIASSCFIKTVPGQPVVAARLATL
jgi:hypothetical protein